MSRLKQPPSRAYGDAAAKKKAIPSIEIEGVRYPLHKVWVTLPDRPLRAIQEIEAGIMVCEKTTWAILPKLHNRMGGIGRRTLLGTGAFYTRAAAERAKLGRLQKLLKVPKWGMSANVAITAKAQLDEYAQSGTMH